MEQTASSNIKTPHVRLSFEEKIIQISFIYIRFPYKNVCFLMNKNTLKVITEQYCNKVFQLTLLVTTVTFLLESYKSLLRGVFHTASKNHFLRQKGNGDKRLKVSSRKAARN